MNALAALEDDEYPSPDDPERTHVPAKFYHPPSIDQAAVELELLYAMNDEQIPSPGEATTNDRWLDEVAQALEWIRRHPPVWRPAPRCIKCGAENAGRNGPPRNDGRPRASSITAVFRPGVGMTTMHTDAANCR